MTVHKIQWKPLLAAGLVSGLVQVAAGLIMYVSGVYFAPWSGPVSLLLLAVSVVIGTRWYVTRVLDGRSTYLTALLAGMAIAVTIGLVYVTYNLVSISFVYPHFLDDMARARFARLHAQGLGASDAGEVLASLRARTTMGTVVGNNLRMFCVFGTVFSALSAVVFRRK